MSFFFKYASTFLLGMLLALTGLAQVIKGTIKDTIGKAIPYANINLKGAAATILAYAVSNIKGEFTLAIPAGTPQAGLTIEVTCIGFAKQSKLVVDIATPYNFVLSTASNQLKEVIVKDSRPFIKTSGDTTSYKVTDYANKQDRVIGDVIKKLPGVQVASDGKITYNGKAISNLYIGGDNLLDDKYNIATNTVPHGAVDKVQVIENDQPVKMLRDKTVSEDVAMNLTFKKDAKLQIVGQEAIGAGIPGKYDVNLNGMMFKDKYKAINYIKGNNIGVDVQEDLISHNLSDYLQRIDNNKPSTFLSTGTANDPDLPRNRYLFNQSGLINLNNLVHLQKDVLLRANMYYLHDTQLQDYQKLTSIYLPNDTVNYAEKQHNRRRPDILHGQFSLNINKDKYYLNDNLTGDYNHNTSYSALNTNGTPVNQVFKDNIADFSNELNLMQTFRTNNILEVYSYINHIAEPENLQITPGLNPQIFNDGNPYNALTQKVDVPTWFTNNYIGYKIPSNGITQTYHAGFSWQQQKLGSDLLATQLNNSNNPAIDSAHNDLSWRRQRLYTEAIYDYPGDKLKVNVTLPLNLQQISYSDANFVLNKQTTHLYFNPRLYVKYQVSAENYFTLAYNFRNQIGSIADIYNGYILKDYRTLFANSANLTEQKDQSAALGFNYRKAISLFFFTLSARYDHISANSISSSIINNSFEQNVVLPFANSTNSWLLSAYASKYLFPLRTTLSGGLSWRSGSSNQVQNNVLLPFKTITTTANISVETKLSSKVDFSYKAVFSELSSKSAAAASPAAVRSFFQQATIGYNPLDKLSFKLSADDYYAHTGASNNEKYIFADASVKYTFSKPKMDVELNANNLFNTRKYNELYLAANTFTSSTYVIPGRIIWLKVYFNI
ncbi:MAG: carboxypeptidase-like regulatory domain-containing protein [Bacteroidota bacterium]